MIGFVLMAALNVAIPTMFSVVDHLAKLTNKPVVKLRGIFRFVFIRHGKEITNNDENNDQKSKNEINKNTISILSLCMQIVNYLYLIAYLVFVMIEVKTQNALFGLIQVIMSFIYFISFFALVIYIVIRDIIYESKKEKNKCLE